MSAEVQESMASLSRSVRALLRGPRLRAVTQTTLANGVIMCFSVASGVLVARLLKPEGRGALAAIQLYPSLLAVLGIWGLPQTIAIRAARKRGESEQARTLGLALAASTVLSIVVVGAYVALCRFVPFPSEGVRWLGLVWGAVWLPLSFVALSLIAIDHGTQRWGRYNLTRMILNPVYLILLLVLAFSRRISLVTVVAALLVANLSVVVVRILLSFRETVPSWPKTGEVTKQLKRGTNYAIANFSAALTAQIDRVLAVTLFDATTVGLYVVALSAASVHSPFSGAVAVKAFAEAAQNPANPGLPRKLLWAVGGTVGVCAVAALLSPTVLPLVYGKEFAQAVPLAVILCVGSVFAGTANIQEEHFRGLGKPYRGAVGRWAGGVSATAICIAARPNFGPLAIAFGYCGGQLARFLVLLVPTLIKRS